VKYGFVLPAGDARTAADLAVELERAGWDGLFMWEPVWGVDAWVSLTAAAMVTERIRLGTMLTPPSRMRPWKLASETATLDNLSGGRVILSVGLGATEVGFDAFGEVTGRKERAELLDEALAIIDGLWRGAPYSFAGKHYTVYVPSDFMTKPPPPVQQPRIPIWCVGAWPSRRSMARVVKWDGLIPSARDPGGDFRQATPGEVREIKDWIQSRRGTESPFDIIIEGATPLDDPTAAERVVGPYREAGATWFIEAMWGVEDHAEVVRRAQAGPPRR
jgi:alkanesulfonate monooxygenase SsuD/methylene tetrahydromethanopterin reductase-like flavin-dependent oxidoreductase (luciferase family)